MELGSELGTTLILSQAAYEFALVINSHSHGVHRSASVNVGSFNVFSKHVSGPGHMHCTLSSLIYVITLVSLYSASKASLASFFMYFWVSMLLMLSTVLCPRESQCECIFTPFKRHHHYPEIHSIMRTEGKQRPASVSLHQESNRQFKIHNHSIFFKGLH